MSIPKLLFILAIIFLFSSCKTIYAPDGALPEAENLPSDPYGAWCVLKLKDSSSRKNKEQKLVMGELIAVDDTSVYVLSDTLLKKIPHKSIETSVIEIDQKNKRYITHACMGTIFTFSHGWLSVFTAPLWLLFGLPVAINETARDRYAAEYPDITYWESVSKFSRFPQGLPEDLNANLLRQRPRVE